MGILKPKRNLNRLKFNALTKQKKNKKTKQKKEKEKMKKRIIKRDEKILVNNNFIKKMLKFDITRQIKHNYTNVIRKKIIFNTMLQ